MIDPQGAKEVDSHLVGEAPRLGVGWLCTPEQSRSPKERLPETSDCLCMRVAHTSTGNGLSG